MKKNRKNLAVRNLENGLLTERRQKIADCQTDGCLLSG